MTRRPFSDIQGAAAIGAHVSKSLKGAKSFSVKKPKKEKEETKKPAAKRPSPAKTQTARKPAPPKPKVEKAKKETAPKPSKPIATKDPFKEYYAQADKAAKSGGLGPVKKAK